MNMKIKVLYDHNFINNYFVEYTPDLILKHILDLEDDIKSQGRCKYRIQGVDYYIYVIYENAVIFRIDCYSQDDHFYHYYLDCSRTLVVKDDLISKLIKNDDGSKKMIKINSIKDYNEEIKNILYAFAEADIAISDYIIKQKESNEYDIEGIGSSNSISRK